MVGKGLYRNIIKEFVFGEIPVSSGMVKFQGLCEIEPEDESLGRRSTKGFI